MAILWDFTWIYVQMLFLFVVICFINGDKTYFWPWTLSQWLNSKVRKLVYSVPFSGANHILSSVEGTKATDDIFKHISHFSWWLGKWGCSLNKSCDENKRHYHLWEKELLSRPLKVLFFATSLFTSSDMIFFFFNVTHCKLKEFLRGGKSPWWGPDFIAPPCDYGAR